jgi:hypothetical protein
MKTWEILVLVGFVPVALVIGAFFMTPFLAYYNK